VGRLGWANGEKESPTSCDKEKQTSTLFTFLANLRDRYEKSSDEVQPKPGFGRGAATMPGPQSGDESRLQVEKSKHRLMSEGPQAYN
jgi:hypothetical protein